MSEELLEAALRYAERGWPVFPCGVRGKLPLFPAAHEEGDPLKGACKGECGQLGHGFYDAVVDPTIVAGWWKRSPRANIGLPTGHAFDVLDVDGEEGWSTLARTVAEHGCLSSSPVSMTGRGGAHDLFLPTGCPNRAGFLPALDWRGAGGYIVAPPSIHPNGKRYEWALSPDEVELEAAPAWLVELVKRHSVPTFSTDPSGASSTTGAYGRRALESECGRVALAVEGTRNDTLNRAAHALGQLVGAHQLEFDEVVSALTAVALRTGLSETEARKTIASGLGAGLRSPRQVKS